MVVHVTQEHISKGRPKDCTLCPVAKAVQFAFKEIDVSVTRIAVIVRNKHYKTPDSVARFIQNFDQHIIEAPFSFELGEPYYIGPTQCD